MAKIVKHKYMPLTVLICIIFLICASFYLRSSVSAAKGEKAVRLPIILYHQVKNDITDEYVITPTEFESDLRYLRDHNYHTITMTQLIDYVNGNGTLPSNPIILCFDDGYLNTYKYAFPLLKQYNMKIVFSIIGKDTDDFTQTPDESLDYSHVTWVQLNEMLDSGYVEVQNHTYNLHGMDGERTGCIQLASESPEEYEQVLASDIKKLQDEILARTGRVPNTVTYPYGKSSENTEAIIKKLGIKATLSCDYGINAITDDIKTLFGLKRIFRYHGDTIERILTEAQKTLS